MTAQIVPASSLIPDLDAIGLSMPGGAPWLLFDAIKERVGDQAILVNAWALYRNGACHNSGDGRCVFRQSPLLSDSGAQLLSLYLAHPHVVARMAEWNEARPLTFCAPGSIVFDRYLGTRPRELVFESTPNFDKINRYKPESPIMPGLAVYDFAVGAMVGPSQADHPAVAIPELAALRRHLIAKLSFWLAEIENQDEESAPAELAGEDTRS